MRNRIQLLYLFLFLWLLMMPCLAIAQGQTIKRKANSKPKVEKRNTAKSNSQRGTRLQEPTGYYSTEYLSDETITVNGVSFVMKGVQGGVFTMGATSEQSGEAYSNEKPIHRVAISSFRIGQTEITQRLWQAVMGNSPSSYKGDGNLPVECVSWNDCQTFISRLNSMTGRHFRLPTEAEWEYAARGGNRSRGYKYAGSNNIGSVAWYTDNSGNATHDVGTKQPNELGLYDMSGNVGEWCQDWYGSYSSFGQTNPQGASSNSERVYRGGGWLSSAGNCRVSIRYSLTPDYRSFNLGLRLAL